MHSIKAKAYPIALMEEMIEYWAKRGDKHAQALINAAWKTDFESSVRQALGQKVSEKNREQMRKSSLTPKEVHKEVHKLYFVPETKYVVNKKLYKEFFKNKSYNLYTA
jgi:hypothetical protein